MAMYDNSRYLHTAMFNRLGWDTPTLDVRQRFTFNEATCRVYVWVEGDTIDGLAAKFFNNTALRWAILDANPQYRTEFDISPGDTILIPDYEEVVSIVNV